MVHVFVLFWGFGVLGSVYLFEIAFVLVTASTTWLAIIAVYLYLIFVKEGKRERAFFFFFLLVFSLSCDTVISD